MKYLSAFILFMLLFLCSSLSFASEKPVLGINHFSIKADYIHFREDIDSSYYIGIEGYRALSNHLYLGVEVGYSSTDSNLDVSKIDPDGVISDFVDPRLDTEVVIVPIELNFKYSDTIFSHFIADIGGGFSYIYTEEEATDLNSMLSDLFVTAEDLGVSDTADDWVWGGQFFLDLTYTVEQFFFGINAKYQITDKSKDSDRSYDNWRAGGTIGVMF